MLKIKTVFFLQIYNLSMNTNEHWVMQDGGCRIDGGHRTGIFFTPLTGSLS